MAFTWFSKKPMTDEQRLARKTLIRAAKDGNSDACLRALFQGAAVDSRDRHGDSVLNLASFQGHPKVVSILLANSATVDKPGKDGMTALMWAAQQNHLDVVDELLEHGADLSARCADGSSVLHQAAFAGAAEAVAALIAAGAAKQLPLKAFIDATNNDGRYNCRCRTLLLTSASRRPDFPNISSTS